MLNVAIADSSQRSTIFGRSIPEINLSTSTLNEGLDFCGIFATLLSSF